MAFGDIRVKVLTPKARSGWDAYVASAPGATFFHRSGWWEIVEDELGHRCHYLYAERSGRTVGVLPLAEVRSRLFGHALISMAFCVYGGIVADDGEAAGALRAAAVELAKQRRVDYLELRNRQPDGSSWPAKDLYVTFRKALLPEHEANFQAIPRKQRAMVRKGIDAGLRVSEASDFEKFYSVYSESLRNLGTPVLPRRFYARVRRVFGDACELTVVEHRAKPVAAVMTFYFRDEAHPYYGGSIRAARGLAANDFMYWAVMQRAVERGAKTFDFGRSKRDTGSFHFKRHWGFEPQPLYYQFKLVQAEGIPNVSPANPKYRFFIRAWQRLPLAVSRVAGPMIARNLA